MSEWESIIGSNRVSSYGTCVRSMMQSTNQYVKHYMDKSDTLQGLSLKYDCSTDELRRINKLYSTDSIFLREYLLVPAPKIISVSDPENAGLPLPIRPSAPPEKEIDAFAFLQQLDSKICARKNAVKDYKFVTDVSLVNDTNQNGALFLRNKDFLKPDQASVCRKKQTLSKGHHFKL